MTASTLDKRFDDGKTDIVEQFDQTSAQRPNLKARRVNVDMPVWMIRSLDSEADRLGITRQSIIKVWLAERLEQTG